jgi:hypothetical protein
VGVGRAANKSDVGAVEARTKGRRGFGQEQLIPFFRGPRCDFGEGRGERIGSVLQRAQPNVAKPVSVIHPKALDDDAS